MSFARRRVLATSFALAALAVSLLVAGAADGQTRKRHSKKHERHQQRVIELHQGGFLGVTMQTLSKDIREGLDLDVDEGVLISQVVEGSPAEKAGLEDGDVIVKFDGKEVDSPERLSELVGETDPGTEVEIEVVRDDRTKTLEVTIGEWDEQAFSWVTPDGDMNRFSLNLAQFGLGPRLGVNVTELDEDLASYFDVDEGEGVLVLNVSDESTAEKAGVKSGDIIVKVKDQVVRGAGDIRKALSEVEKGDEVDITVIRKKKELTLTGEAQQNDRFEFARQHLRGLREHAPNIELLHEGRDELREQMEELRKDLNRLKKRLDKAEKKSRR